MQLALGLLLVLIAGVLQGTFILPMTLTRGWKWEHTWAAFSLLGMLVFNWVIGWTVLPHLGDVLRNAPVQDIRALLFFGACWGVGAILFGMGMERLGMAVGYPVIMGLILSLGALIPLAETGLARIATRPGLLVLAGTAVVLFGIVLCSRASAARTAAPGSSSNATTGTGLTIAIFAGVLSCLPNVGLAHAASLTESAIRFGAAPSMAGNAAWVVQFTAGFAVNFLYCLGVIAKRRNAALFTQEGLVNIPLVAVMALMWIGSFYLYGMGAARMGRLGAIVGWPLFISLSILVGNLWGIVRGEWRKARPAARSQLNLGLAVVLIAVLIFGLGSAWN